MDGHTDKYTIHSLSEYNLEASAQSLWLFNLHFYRGSTWWIHLTTLMLMVVWRWRWRDCDWQVNMFVFDEGFHWGGLVWPVTRTVARTSEWQSYRWLVIIVKWFMGLTFSCLRFECLRSNWRQVYLNLWALCWQDLILVYECFHFGQWPLIVILRWHGPGLADWHCVRSKVPLCAWWPLNPGDQTEGCPHLVGSSWSWYHLICSCHIEIF